MKMQSYISVLAILGVSIASLLSGYWLGYEERRELSQFLVRSIESEQQNRAAETRDSLRMLAALREGREGIVVELLTDKVKSGLKPIPPIGHEIVDHLSRLGNPNEATMQEAIAYQEQYCSDPCLGL